MRKLQTLILFTATAVIALAWQAGFQTKFNVEKSAIAPLGTNRYWLFTPGTQLYYAHGKDTMVSTVLPETRNIAGYETRVFEDREMKNGQLSEVTRDYYGIDKTNGDVYYFGEDVDEYKNGKISGHGGTWLHGVKGAQFGLMMPGQSKTGQKFYQEQAPGVGVDRAEVVSVSETVKVAAGTFTNCVHMKETSSMEAGVTEHKWYAPGVGLIKEGEFELVKIVHPAAGK